MRRGAPLRRTAIRRRSARRQDEIDREGGYRDAVMAMHVRDGHACRAEALVPEVACAGRLDPHHVRGRDGDLLAALEWLVQLCRAHHDWVHANGRRARDLGLLA